MKYLLTVELTFRECCDIYRALATSDVTDSQSGACKKVMESLAEIIELHDYSEELRAISRMVERDREATTGENAPAEPLE